MKLLMISGDRSILQGKKGAFYYTLEEFSKHWDRIDVICPSPPYPLSREERGNPFPNVHFHPSPYALWRQPWWILEKGDELINEHHHNVMTVHEYPPFYNGIGARWLHRSTNIPYMTEIHHIVGYPKAANLTEWIGYWMSRVWIPRWGTSAATIVRVVDFNIGLVLSDWRVQSEKIHWISSIYLDFDALKIDNSIPKKYDVVFCGRLVANKGLNEIIQAISTIPRASLLVIGDGPERKNAEELAQSLGISSRITFAGWLPTNQSVYRAIQSGKIFVMNSKSEGGPRVIFEAMHLGMPIIATKVGLAKDYLQDGAAIFTDGTSADLSEKISRLLSDEGLRTQLGSSALAAAPHLDRKWQMGNYARVLQNLHLHPSVSK